MEFGEDEMVKAIKFFDYLELANDEKNPLTLPLIQRGFVWKPWQIVELWDSLLRGMPIGSMMVGKVAGQGTVLGPDRKTQVINNINVDSISLFDGQQRTIALMIGSSEKQAQEFGFCLWIDLSENGINGANFLLRLTSDAQPFGFNQKNHSRLSRHDRHKAKEKYNENINKFGLIDLKIKQLPYKASNIGTFIPVHVVIELFKKYILETITDEDKKKFSCNVFEKISKYNLEKNNSEDATVKNNIDLLFEALINLRILQIPLIKINDDIIKDDIIKDDRANKDNAEEAEEDISSPLIILFERLGRNGTRLDPADLLFSIIKNIFPDAQNIVNSIANQEHIRSFMGGVEYVATAYRIVSAEHEIADNYRVKPKDIRRNLKNIYDVKDKLCLKSLIKEGNDLFKSFKFLYEAIKYDVDNNKDGIPVALIPYLPLTLIQPVIYWATGKSEDTIISNKSKIIAFCLYWVMHVLVEGKASLKAFDVIKKNGSDKSDVFPLKNLYSELINGDDKSSMPLVSYCRLKEIIRFEEFTEMKNENDVFKKDVVYREYERELIKRFLFMGNYYRKPILLWLQREYVSDFTKEILNKIIGISDEDCVPYDFDHICPQSHWGADSRIYKEIKNQSFKDNRNTIGNCIGNLHVLESSENRGNSDNSINEKMTDKFKKNAQIPENSLESWIAASNKDENDKLAWSDNRIKAFQKAVFTRAFHLYKSYYKIVKEVSSEGCCCSICNE